MKGFRKIAQPPAVVAGTVNRPSFAWGCKPNLYSIMKSVYFSSLFKIGGFLLVLAFSAGFVFADIEVVG